jgi:hypothetical protein
MSGVLQFKHLRDVVCCPPGGVVRIANVSIVGNPVVRRGGGALESTPQAKGQNFAPNPPSSPSLNAFSPVLPTHHILLFHLFPKKDQCQHQTRIKATIIPSTSCSAFPREKLIPVNHGEPKLPLPSSPAPTLLLGRLTLFLLADPKRATGLTPHLRSLG